MEFKVGQIFATDEEKLQVAIAEAHLGLAEGGIPIGAALFDQDGRLLGSGRNRRVQDGDASMHGETSAFRNAGRQRSYKNVTLATSLSPCWYCSGLIRQFGIGRVIVGDDKNFMGGQDWVAEHGAEVHVLNDPGLIEIMREFIEANDALWNEDIGED
ncbi:MULTISPECIES: nucleoside deaminase [Rhodoluna]|jgi:cytosine/creatinine deaminase|uniref:nucleoside deaminase n=1 Tax=Rhodoluna TaxID=529883 RepID=UPI00110727BC|nr:MULTISPECIES: nucleoside deaminase [Rhodoluna]BDS48716.1 tRNA-specific adenosine deaminase [Rhodoluna sp. KAS3]